MRLSIVVLTYNRCEALSRCLKAILRTATTPAAEREILVVNNASTDYTKEYLDGLAEAGVLKAIHMPTNAGVCSRNEALKIAQGEYVAQIDDDVETHPSWDATILAPMEANPEIGATGQHGFYQEQSWERQPWSAGLIDDRRRPQPGQFCDLVMGFCWAWRNQVNCAHCDWSEGEDAPRRWDLGHDHKPFFCYDERFNPFWHEESDIQLQIRAAGYRIMCVQPVATHRTLHPWGETKADRGITAMSGAEKNFEYLKQKWQGNKQVKYEGRLVGLG